MRTFIEWLVETGKINGIRGVGGDELRKMAQAQATGTSYSSPTMKSGDVYFDTGEDAKQRALGYIHQGGGGDKKLGATQKSAGKGYLFNIEAPEDAVDKPDFKTDTGHDVAGAPTYRVVHQMKPDYVPTYQSVRPHPDGPINLGGMSISRPAVVSKPKPLGKFLDRYNRMFGNKQLEQQG